MEICWSLGLERSWRRDRWVEGCPAKPMSAANCFVSTKVVRTEGLEPSRRCHLRILSPVCLPVPPRPHERVADCKNTLISYLRWSLVS